MRTNKQIGLKNLQLGLFDLNLFLKTAPCVPMLRDAVSNWRDESYKGATSTTHALLNFWFFNDHRLPNGRIFKYHKSQQEAIETLIYVYEVAKVRRRKDLIEKFAASTTPIPMPGYDEFARYCTKMATGSGKTMVMSMAIVWHYLNAVFEDENEYAKTFLIIAPNVIVYERLKLDFEDGRIFNMGYLIPREFKAGWDFDYIMRGDTERVFSDGMLFLTNIHQLYEKPEGGRKRTDNEEPEIMVKVLGAKPKEDVGNELIGLTEMLLKRSGKLLVLNDEAHHTHDEGNDWNTIIRKLHDKFPIAAQLDFSATPRFERGGLFPWVISDYPIKQAIVDGVVKRPIKGIANIDEVKSSVASERYRGFLVAGVERWREYRDQLSGVGKKPLLFIMMNTTDEAEDVGNWLRVTYPSEFGGTDKTLIIHTDVKGEVSKKDLVRARRLAREVDDPDCPTNAIVSVLMLREGWDVQNVTVVVGLRPYTASANVLPEQTIGRGLRLMFRGEPFSEAERVDIIGNKAFISFVDELERLEEIQLDTFDLGKEKLKITTISPQLSEKAQFDLSIPRLSPILVRKKAPTEEINGLDVMSFKFNPDPLPLNPKGIDITKIPFIGYDLITDEKLLEREFAITSAQRPDQIVSFYAKLIANSLRLPSQFSALVPKVWDFFERRAFGKKIDMNDPAIVQAMNHRVATMVVLTVFAKALKDKIIQEVEVTLERDGRLLSSIEPFAHARLVFEATKCILNLVPCDNDFEREFVRFLEKAEDVAAFSKLPLQFGFAIEYMDDNANLRYYYPDFVVKTYQRERWLVETKGLETAEVRFKDRAAKLWCENATILTGQRWQYIKVPQEGYEELQPEKFSDLMPFLV